MLRVGVDQGLALAQDSHWHDHVKMTRTTIARITVKDARLNIQRAWVQLVLPRHEDLDWIPIRK